MVLANIMFDLPAVEFSEKARDGAHLFVAEIVATFGLIMIIHGTVRAGYRQWVAAAVAAYIGGVLLHGIDELCQPCP